METVKEKKKNEGFGAFKPLTKYGVYFANLSAYNSGRLIGKWVYPLLYDSFDDFAEAIKEATKKTAQNTLMRLRFMIMIISQIWANIQIMKVSIIWLML